MNKLPRIFCVTLKETPLRTNGFLQLASQAGIEPIVFHGLWGNRLAISPKLPNDIEYPNKNIFMNEAAIGCCMSHYMLWNTIQYLPEDEFLIFEDDAIIPLDFIPKFEKLYDALPVDWEFVYVGWVPYGKDHAPVTVSEGISIRLPSATHAYMLKKSALETLFSGILPLQSPIDLTIIKKCLPKMKYYVFDPPLVNQRSYANTKDPVWMSLIYDWKSDLYGFKRKILRDFNLFEGWHQMEQNANSAWRWSHDKFSIQLPKGINKINISFVSPIKNSISLFCNNRQTDFAILTGENTIQIDVAGADILIGKMYEPFIPAQHEPDSKDNRQLGICLKSIAIDLGSSNIDVDVTEL